MRELLSYRSAASRFGIHVTELQRGVNRGEIRQKSFSFNVGFDPSDVEAWLWKQSKMAPKRGYVKGAAETIAQLARLQPENPFLPELMKNSGVSSAKAKLAGLSDIDVQTIRELESRAPYDGAAA